MSSRGFKKIILELLKKDRKFFTLNQIEKKLPEMFCLLVSPVDLMPYGLDHPFLSRGRRIDIAFLTIIFF